MSPSPTELPRLDLATWPRRDAFDFYRRAEQPHFGLCTRLDVAALRTAARGAGVPFTLAWQHLLLREAQRVEPLRYRLAADRDPADGGVLVVPQLHSSTTVLRDDGRFAFCLLAWDADFAAFAARAAAALAQARRAGGLAELGDPLTQLFSTTLPWVHFSSFQHARRRGEHESVPRLAFGRIDADGARQWMPFAIEAHHALVDGLHLGQLVQGLEAALAGAMDWVRAPR